MTLKITKADYVKSVMRAHHAPEVRPSVIFAGRSNVGKSSLLNKIVNRRQLARTSKTPGRTQEIHYYNINDRYYFIDLPGYGYANVPVAVKKKWGPMIERFLAEAEGIRLVVMLLDSRRKLTEDDIEMINWLELNVHPYIFAVTKVDKLGANDLKKNLKRLQVQLKLEDDHSLIPVSVVKNLGLTELMDVLESVLDAPETDPAEAPDPSDEPKPANEDPAKNNPGKEQA